MYLGITLIAANIIYSLIILCIFFFKERVDTRETKLYGCLIIVNMISLILELLCCYTVKNYENLGIITDVVNRIFLLSIFSWETIFTVYIYSISTKRETKKLIDKDSKLFVPFTIFIIVASILLLILPIEYFNENNTVYSYGLSTDFLYAIAVVYFIGWIVFFLKGKDKAYKRKYAPILVLILIMAIALSVRAIDPGFLIISPSFAIVTNFMYFTIENPDVKMNNQLELAKEQADKANSAKTDFLSSMSHEIRTPLNAINGFSNMIEDSKTLEEAKSNAKDIVRASETLLEIVNGILDISKIEAGKLEIVESPYEARETFEELAKLITPRMEEKGLDFTYYIAPDIPDTLYGDHANIKKIITNFLSNAAKYTEKGFVKYEVNCVKTNDKCKLIISVEDSGRGIKKENIDKLFAKFDRLDVERNTTVEGTGLGLAITKQLVELMGGKIIVHTVYGEGSKFTVMIDQKIEKTEILKIKPKKRDSIDLSSTKILLVDDNELNLKVGAKMLGKYGATSITQAHSGFECIDLVKENNYDIILLDDMMPKMSGSEALVELKKLPNFNTPVVVLTANAISGMREKYLAAGFDEYLPKPIEKDEFLRVLNKLLLGDKTEEIAVIQEPEVLEEKEEQQEEKRETEIIEEPPEINNQEDFLRNHGVDMDKALELLGDMEMYNMTFKDFEKELEPKWSRIEEEKLSGDMENYAIDVHSLKSDCKYLGFYDLADIAYEHELKSKENDKEFVNDNFDKLEREYEKVLNIVKEYKDRI